MADVLEPKESTVRTEHGAIRWFVGAVTIILCITAAMKLHGLLTDPFIDLRSGWSDGFLGFVAGVEIAAVIGLLSIRSTRVQCGMITLLFGIFTAVQIVRWVRGSTDCGCVGSTSIDIRWMMLVDSLIVTLGALATLWTYQRPRSISPISSNARRSTPSEASRLIAMSVIPVIGFLAFDSNFENRVRAVTQGRPPIAISRTDLGPLTVGKSRLVSITLVNNGAVPIETSGIESSCDCLIAGELPEEIPANHSKVVTVRSRPGRSGWYRQEMRIFLRCERQPFVVAEFFGFVEEKVVK